MPDTLKIEKIRSTNDLIKCILIDGAFSGGGEVELRRIEWEVQWRRKSDKSWNKVQLTKKNYELMEYSIKLLTDQLLNLNLAINKYKNGKEFNPQSPAYKDTQEKIRDLERGIKILKDSKI